LLIQKPGKRVEPLLPELARMIEPVGSLLHRLRGQSAAHDPTLLLPPDKARALENLQMLHKTRERHGKGTRELADRPASGGEQLYHLPASRVGESREHRVERLVYILNHKV
jgi:hypothetical protein